MHLVSVSENKDIEKRLAITPEISSKYLNLGFSLSLPNGYGDHLGFKDDDYKKLGVNISTDEKNIIKNADIIVQLGLPDNEKLSLMRENQTLIGTLNSYSNRNCKKNGCNSFCNRRKNGF